MVLGNFQTRVPGLQNLQKKHSCKGNRAEKISRIYFKALLFQDSSNQKKEIIAQPKGKKIYAQKITHPPPPQKTNCPSLILTQVCFNENCCYLDTEKG